MGYDDTDRIRRREFMNEPTLTIRQKKEPRNPTPVSLESEETSNETASVCCAELHDEIAALKLTNHKQLNEIEKLRRTVQNLTIEKDGLKKKITNSEISIS